MTKEEQKIANKAINLAYQMIKEETTDCSFEIIKEVLVDYFMEFDNGFSNSMLKYIEKNWNLNKKL